jgi:hypothetical protein
VVFVSDSIAVPSPQPLKGNFGKRLSKAKIGREKNVYHPNLSSFCPRDGGSFSFSSRRSDAVFISLTPPGDDVNTPAPDDLPETFRRRIDSSAQRTYSGPLRMTNSFAKEKNRRAGPWPSFRLDGGISDFLMGR